MKMATESVVVVYRMDLRCGWPCPRLTYVTSYTPEDSSRRLYQLYYCITAPSANTAHSVTNFHAVTNFSYAFEAVRLHVLS